MSKSYMKNAITPLQHAIIAYIENGDLQKDCPELDQIIDCLPDMEPPTIKELLYRAMNAAWAAGSQES